MAQNNTPVKALVLAGGGARGSYQVGVWRALIEYGGFDAAGEVVQRAERNYSTNLPALLQAQLPARWISARPLA
jgi:predicted acylesterase/phospholipase RssA